ncbi:MAG: PQQ-dependent sugar dehydrogenase [Pirellulales bacterium]|nr:PQQ-dependent sugar dehydrogenase [Pirellulales bacterium]
MQCRARKTPLDPSVLYRQRFSWQKSYVLLVCCGWVLAGVVVLAQGPAAPPAAKSLPATPQWIWHAGDGTDVNAIPAGTRYFRFTFNTKATFDNANLEIAADDAYELFVNGQSVGTGRGAANVGQFDLTPFLVAGPNALAVRVENTAKGSAGLMTSLSLRTKSSPVELLVSNARWKSTDTAPAGWEETLFADANWPQAGEWGPYGGTAPWGAPPGGVFAGRRFQPLPGFIVECVADPALTGSLTRFQFDHLGRPLVTREGPYALGKSDPLPGQGATFVLTNPDGNGKFQNAELFSSLVLDCQGYFDLLGNLYCVGVGAEGPGVYRQSGPVGGARTKAELLYAIPGKYHYHGPHQILLGPDARWYVSFGYEAGPVELAANSPYRDWYEGHALLPLIDPRAQRSAPGGMVLRSVDGSGKTWNAFAGGFRNQYGIAFDATNDLWAWDSDQEGDVNLPWYRPNRLEQVIAGGEYGWRNGGGVWPEYYPDGLPATANTGRGSPSGMVCYRHTAFPAEYHGALFCGDWSLGRILAVFPPAAGSSALPEWREFLTGQPLTVTDLDVGPDGHLYFCTGGGNTQGGLYRVRYVGPAAGNSAAATATPNGKTDQAAQANSAALSKAERAIQAAIGQPQPQSAWGLAAIAAARQTAGTRWDSDLPKLTADPGLPLDQRLRGLAIRRLFGPLLTSAEITSLLKEKEPQLRAYGARCVSDYRADAQKIPWMDLLADASPLVQRAVLETQLAVNLPLTTTTRERIVNLLSSENRQVRFLALRALCQDQPAELTPLLAATESPRASALLMIAVAVASRDPALATQLWQRQNELLSHSRPGTGLVNPFADPAAEATPADPAANGSSAEKTWNDETWLDMCRAFQLTAILYQNTWQTFSPATRPANVPPLPEQARETAGLLWEQFSKADYRVQREMAAIAVLANLPDTAEVLLRQMRAGIPREQQFHYALCLSQLRGGWTNELRLEFLDWHCQAQAWGGIRSSALILVFESWLAGLPPDQAGAFRRQRKDRQPERVELLPHKPVASKYSAAQISEYLAGHTGNASLGLPLLEKSRCLACHRFGAAGEAAAPDLSAVGRRFSRQDLIDSLIYPSKVIADQYRGRVYTLKDGRSVSGVPLAESDTEITVMQADVTRATIPKVEIDESEPAPLSLMPEGLLNELSLAQIADLLAALESGPPEDGK